VTASPKPPIDPVRWQPPPVDPLPDFPAADVTVVPVGGDGPEDIVVDDDGQLWTGLVDGRIVRISPNGGETTVIGETGGRALGLAVARDGRLLVCTSPGGLLAMDSDTGKFETLVDEVDGRRLQFCSNVTEMPDGTIYFTESTSALTYAHYMWSAV
jgi:sugar lactone lactonase YvrE